MAVLGKATWILLRSKRSAVAYKEEDFTAEPLRRKNYEVVRALAATKTPGEVSFDELMRTLMKHYDTRPSELFSRTRFQQRDKMAGESISSYVAASKKLAANCNFGVLTAPPAAVTASTSTTASAGEAQSPARQAELNQTLLPLEIMLRDCLVCGLRDEHLQ